MAKTETATTNKPEPDSDPGLSYSRTYVPTYPPFLYYGEFITCIDIERVV
jgi:hypothetical protein